MELIFNYILILILIKISIKDLKSLLIDDNDIILIVILWIAKLPFIYTSYPEALYSLGLALIIYLALSIISYSTKFIFKKQTLGEGDIKLASSCSLFLGDIKAIEAIGLAFLLALIFILVAKTFKKTYKEIPFAPFISLATIIELILIKTNLLDHWWLLWKMKPL